MKNLILAVSLSAAALAAFSSTPSNAGEYSAGSTCPYAPLTETAAHAGAWLATADTVDGKGRRVLFPAAGYDADNDALIGFVQSDDMIYTAVGLVIDDAFVIGVVDGLKVELYAVLADDWANGSGDGLYTLVDDSKGTTVVSYYTGAAIRYNVDTDAPCNALKTKNSADNTSVVNLVVGAYRTQ